MSLLKLLMHGDHILYNDESPSTFKFETKTYCSYMYVILVKKNEKYVFGRNHIAWPLVKRKSFIIILKYLITCSIILQLWKKIFFDTTVKMKHILWDTLFIQLNIKILTKESN